MKYIFYAFFHWSIWAWDPKNAEFPFLLYQTNTITYILILKIYVENKKTLDKNKIYCQSHLCTYEMSTVCLFFWFLNFLSFHLSVFLSFALSGFCRPFVLVQPWIFQFARKITIFVFLLHSERVLSRGEFILGCKCMRWTKINVFFLRFPFTFLNIFLYVICIFGSINCIAIAKFVYCSHFAVVDKSVYFVEKKFSCKSQIA